MEHEQTNPATAVPTISAVPPTSAAPAQAPAAAAAPATSAAPAHAPVVSPPLDGGVTASQAPEARGATAVVAAVVNPDYVEKSPQGHFVKVCSRIHRGCFQRAVSCIRYLECSSARSSAAAHSKLFTRRRTSSMESSWHGTRLTSQNTASARGNEVGRSTMPGAPLSRHALCVLPPQSSTRSRC